MDNPKDAFVKKLDNIEIVPKIFCELHRTQFKSMRGARLHIAKAHVRQPKSICRRR